jgi:phosphocarrier protein HPr
MQKVVDTKLKVKGTIIIVNDRGLHTRPSTEIVKCSTAFKSDIKLCYQGMEVNAKSLLGILMLAAARGARIEVIAEGVDAKEAVAALLELARQKFNINY